MGDEKMECAKLGAVIEQHQKVVRTAERTRQQRVRAYAACRSRNAALAQEYEHLRDSYHKEAKQVRECQAVADAYRSSADEGPMHWASVVLLLEVIIFAILWKLYHD